MSEATLNHILEIFYILIGLQFLYTDLSRFTFTR